MNVSLSTFAIFGAEYLYFVLILIAVIQFFLLIKSKRQQVAMLAITTLPISFIILKIAGALYNNPRPFVTDGVIPLIAHKVNNGFPSDHTILCAVIASLIFSVHKKTGIILWILTLLVGASRVYVGVHHPVDVVTSMLIAVVVAYACSIVNPKLLKFTWYVKIQELVKKYV
ncbi:MAG: phosphatase PAP2 family protein [Candidatus Peregrinibacteria bacterium]|nr:phosphatase PAP2 family protein [Candidatus Peregrinibacteria bacterium]